MKKDINTNLRLRELRLENHYMQRAVSDQLHCTQQTYSRYETGALKPSLSVLAKLADFYGTSVDYIMRLTDEKTPHKRAHRKQAES